MNGAGRVAKAQPDGYTLLLGIVGTQAQNQTLYKSSAYDSTKDFASVGLFLEAPAVLVVREDLPVNSRNSSPTQRPMRPTCSSRQPVPVQQSISATL